MAEEQQTAPLTMQMTENWVRLQSCLEEVSLEIACS